MDGFLHRLIAQIIAGSGLSVFLLVNFSEEANITLIRNICELGYNGAVWGNIGEAVVEVKHGGILEINNLQLR